MRLFKWAYTLPAWNKSYHMLKHDVHRIIEAERNADTPLEHQREAFSLDGPAVSSASNVAVDRKLQPSPSSPQPHSMSASLNAMLRLPWFSTLEFVSHTVSIVTDLCDDIQWYTSVDILSKRIGDRAASVGPRLWITSVLIDLALTYRQQLGLRQALQEAESNAQQLKSAKKTTEQAEEELKKLEQTQAALRLGIYNQNVTLIKLTGDLGAAVPVNFHALKHLPEWWVPTFNMISASAALHKLWIQTKP